MSEQPPTSEPGDSAAVPGGGDAATGPPAPGEHTYWQRVRLGMLRVTAVLGAFVLLMILLTAGAATYTSRPQFCISCHIMQPYYDSWAHSSHKDVSCIKCHFPPGAAEKIRGKMLGLVQLLKYVTESAGPRPAAEISDASCLRCHDTRLLAGRVQFHGVTFDHRPHLTQLRRGKRLRCTSCHSQIVQGTHMTVTTSTCFLCHFKDEPFNEGLGTCTRCHQIPENTFDLGGGVKFSHDLAYQRGVDCSNCHGDIIRGSGAVPRQRCTACHNREVDLDRINDHQFIHKMHVTVHKIDCLECHLEIQHSLDPLRIQHAAANCASCHPNQHGEQVRMLLGEGGKSVPQHHGGMAVAGLSCPTCHQVKQVSPTGTVIWKASTEVCTRCHDEAAAERLRTYHEQLQDSLSVIDADLKRARDAVSGAGLDQQQAVDLTKRLNDLDDDLEFVRVGNSIHNIHYADTLVHALVTKLRAICRELNIEEPPVDLPPEGNLAQ